MRRAERGHALVLALLVLVLASLAVALAAELFAEAWRAGEREASRARLLALTDAALAATLAELARSPSFPGLPEQELGGGRLKSEVQALAGGEVEVRCRATLGGRAFATRARVDLASGRPRVLEWAILGSAGADP